MGAALLAAVEIDRDAARDAAVRELADPRYAADDPSLLERVSRRVIEELSDLLGDAAAFVPGGAWGLVIAVMLLVVLAAVAATVGRRILREQRASGSIPLFDGERVLTAQDHRSAAERAEAEARWADAVRERLRAIVRGLEERGLLAIRPGRTADEAAEECARLAPEQASDLRRLAQRFDAVSYGGAEADADDAAAARRLDEALLRLRATRPTTVGRAPR
jgi:hypothetical protein